MNINDINTRTNSLFKRRFLELSGPKVQVSQRSNLLIEATEASHLVCSILTHSFSGYSLSILGFPNGSVGKKYACNTGDAGLIPGLGRSPGGGNGNPLLCSCLENSMDRGAWRATVHGVAKSRI